LYLLSNCNSFLKFRDMNDADINTEKALQEEDADNSYEEVEETEEVEYEEVEEVEEEHTTTLVEQNEGDSEARSPLQENEASAKGDTPDQSPGDSSTMTQHAPESLPGKNSESASPVASTSTKSVQQAPVFGGTGGELDLKAIEAQATKVLFTLGTTGYVPLTIQSLSHHFAEKQI
jgi:hypothetical protein